LESDDYYESGECESEEYYGLESDKDWE